MIQKTGTTPRVAFVDLRAQHQTIADEIYSAVSELVESGDFVLGESVSRFEEEFSAFCGRTYGIGVDSGTSALALALRAHGIGAGDEVITPANTFIATALAVTHTGATPVFVDIDPVTRTLDWTQLEATRTTRTRAVIPVHIYGHPADMDPIRTFAARYELAVIEDACQAHGARYKKTRVGALGSAAAFSFYPSKNLGALGDGGIVITDDSRIASKVRSLRNYGSIRKNWHDSIGYNCRLDSLHAAVLRIKLRRLDEWNAARRSHAETYARLLSAVPVTVPQVSAYAEPVYHVFSLLTEARDALQEHLGRDGIATGQHYPVPIHLQPAYRHLGHERGDFPITEEYALQSLSLPMYPELTGAALQYVANSIRRFFEGRHRR